MRYRCADPNLSCVTLTFTQHWTSSVTVGQRGCGPEIWTLHYRLRCLRDCPPYRVVGFYIFVFVRRLFHARAF